MSRSLATPHDTAITTSDVREGRVAERHALSAAALGSVFESVIPIGRLAGPCTVLASYEALALATGEARAAFSSDEGWAPLLGSRFGRAVINADEPQHAQDRRRWAGAFAPAQLVRFLPAIDTLITQRTERWAAVPDFDVYPAAREFTFAALGITLAGFADDGFLARIQALFSAVLDPPADGESDLDRHLRVAPFRDELEPLLRRHVAQHPRSASAVPSLIDHLRREDPTLSDEAILAHLNLLLVTGHETSASLLTWLLHYAAKPQWQGWLREELDTVSGPEDGAGLAMLNGLPRLNAFVREVGRLRPPFICAPRVCIEDVAIAGRRIPKGSRVALSYGGANMSASAFSEPTAFRPHRWTGAPPPRVATFGAGHRHCVGMSFAHMTLKMVVARLIDRYQIDRGDGPEPVNTGFWGGRPIGGPRLGLRPLTATGLLQHRREGVVDFTSISSIEASFDASHDLAVEQSRSANEEAEDDYGRFHAGRLDA